MIMPCQENLTQPASPALVDEANLQQSQKPQGGMEGLVVVRKKRPRKEDLTGNRYHKLVVIGFSRGETARDRHWICRCDCGTDKEVRERGLKEETSRSCGCLQLEHAKTLNRKHGMYESRLYKSWEAMKTRCFDPKCPNASNYSERGITCCNFLAESAENLLAIIGDRPPNMSLDRIDNNGNYSCGSCPHCQSRGWPLNIRWLTQKEQTRNTRRNRYVVIDGERKCMSEWASIYGLTFHEFKKRITSGAIPTNEIL